MTVKPETTQMPISDTTRMLLFLQENVDIMNKTTIPQIVRETIVPGMNEERRNNALLALRRRGFLSFICRGTQYKSPKDYFINYDQAKFPPSVKAIAPELSKVRSLRLSSELSMNGQPIKLKRGQHKRSGSNNFSNTKNVLNHGNFNIEPTETEVLVNSNQPEDTLFEPSKAPSEAPKAPTEAPKAPSVEVPLNLNDLKGGFSLTLNINFTINK